MVEADNVMFRSVYIHCEIYGHYNQAGYYSHQLTELPFLCVCVCEQVSSLSKVQVFRIV